MLEFLQRGQRRQSGAGLHREPERDQLQHDRRIPVSAGERPEGEAEVGGYAETDGCGEKKRVSSLIFSQKSCISMKGSYIILKDSYNYTILSVFLLFYFVL